MDYVCAKCGKSFTAKKRRGRKFCSYECGKSGITGRPHQRIAVACEVCEKELYRSPCRLGVRQFCSPDCRWKGLSGPNSPNWRGGYAPYYGDNWDQVKRMMLKKCNYACRECGATKVELGKHPDVHHIIPIKTFKGNWKQANVLSNLTVLCRACHQRLERNFDKARNDARHQAVIQEGVGAC